MPKEKDKGKEFLDKFTEEMILNVGKDLEEKEKEKKEKERIRKAIEVQKLKEKFAKETVEEIKPGAPPIVAMPAPVIKPQLPKPAPRPAVMPQPQRPAAQARPALPVQPKPAPRPAEKPPAPKAAPPPLVNIEPPKTLLPGAPGEIDFGKIAFLIKDNLVTYVECPGPGKNIIIRKAGSTVMTKVILIKEEVMRIIKSFSEKTRIPLVEGMLIARYENMEISAVVSETAEPSFIIKKDIIPPVKRPPTQLLPPAQPYQGPMPMRPPIAPARTPGIPQAMPPAQAKPEEKKESFFKRKIRIGK